MSLAAANTGRYDDSGVIRDSCVLHGPPACDEDPLAMYQAYSDSTNHAFGTTVQSNFPMEGLYPCEYTVIGPVLNNNGFAGGKIRVVRIEYACHFFLKPPAPAPTDTSVPTSLRICLMLDYMKGQPLPTYTAAQLWDPTILSYNVGRPLAAYSSTRKYLLDVCVQDPGKAFILSGGALSAYMAGPEPVVYACDCDIIFYNRKTPFSNDVNWNPVLRIMNVSTVPGVVSQFVGIGSTRIYFEVL